MKPAVREVLASVCAARMKSADTGRRRVCAPLAHCAPAPRCAPPLPWCRCRRGCAPRVTVADVCTASGTATAVALAACAAPQLDDLAGVDRPSGPARAAAAIHSENDALAVSSSSSSAGVTGRFCSSHRFITCSTSHAASPRSIRPTMRPLPFSVWKARRSVVSASRSSGLLAAIRQRGVDGLQHLLRLFEEDLEQLGVDPGRGPASTRARPASPGRAGRCRNGRSLEGNSSRSVAVERRRRVALLVAPEEKRDRLLVRVAAVAAGLEEEADAGEAFGDPVHVVGRGALAARLREDQALADRRCACAAPGKPSTESAPCICRR